MKKKENCTYKPFDAFKFVYEYLAMAEMASTKKGWILAAIVVLGSSNSIPRRFSGKVLTFSFDKGFPVIIANKSFFLHILHFLYNATF